MRDRLLVAGAAILGLFWACHRPKDSVGEKDVAERRGLRIGDLSKDEQNAVTCAFRLGREAFGLKDMMEAAVLTSVSPGPTVKPGPPNWRAEGSWRVQFVGGEVAAAPPEVLYRDGSFSIVVLSNPCRLLHILRPG